MPMLMTMSISCAPSASACAVSAIFAAVLQLPFGKPTTVATFSVSPYSATMRGTYDDGTMTVAVWYFTASSQMRWISAQVAVCFRSVWSTYARISSAFMTNPPNHQVNA